MDGERELRIRVCRCLVQLALLHALAGAAETRAEREMGVRVAQGTKEAADGVSPLARGADDAQGRGSFSAARLDALEEQALELTAVVGAIRVNAAVAAIIGGAGLSQSRRALSARRANGQAQRLQPGGVVIWPQSDVGEDDAIAAKPASGAKRRDGCGVGMLRIVQTPEAKAKRRLTQTRLTFPFTALRWRRMV